MSLPAHDDSLIRARATSSLGRIVRGAFALAVLAAAARLVQLGWESGGTDGGQPPVAAVSAGGGIRSDFSAGVRASEPGPLVATADLRPEGEGDVDAEMARLYARCPTAGAISLEDVVRSPEKVDTLLPGFRMTAARESAAPGAHPSSDVRQAPPKAVPRIRYPVTVRPADGRRRGGIGTDRPSMRIAMAPRIAAGSTKEAADDDWLIDPSEWFTEEELANQRREAPDPSANPPSSDSRVEGLTEETAATSPTPLPEGEGERVKAASPETLPERLDDGQPPSTPWQVPQETRPEEAEPRDPPASDFALPPASAIAPEELPAGENPPRVEIFDAPPAVPPDQEAATADGGPRAGGVEPATGDDVDPHLALFAKNCYPSSRDCAVCHEEIYEQWSVSAHAYAAVSPMYNKFEQKLNDLSQGTVGYFCMRCHAPVATAMSASRAEPLWNLPEVAREGITCIACHRVKYVYGKSNGERRIEPGDVFAPVYGGIGGEGVAEAIHRKEEFKVKTSPEEKGPGQNLHAEGIYFDPLTRSEACTPCHQVAVHPGIKLEVVWEQYRASPACKKGIQCQDCHMGRVPGLPLGYDIGAIAKVNGKTVNDHRKKSNHMFHGPNYSIAHPGVFPFNLKANRWTIEEWLAFDWRAGWGTEEFEDRVEDGEIAAEFPPCWAEADDRYDAREILDANLEKLELKRENRRQVMENGSKVEGPFFDSVLCRGEDLRFHYMITNTNEGHNLLTASLGAQPQLWANIVLVGPDGRRLWETGYVDSYGDLANIHSEDVRHGRLPYDWQLFNLQTMFLITGAKGTDREFFVPVNLDIDQLPFIRPGAQPISVINHPPFIRMESQSLAATGSRRVPYRIPGELIRQPGRYRLSFRMRNRAEPMYFMRFCDATPEMQRMMNEWMIDVHPMSVEFEIH